MACREDAEPEPAAELAFSLDTLRFDTVFVTMGSTTGGFKVYNHSNRPVKIPNIKLAGGENSPFRMNVDGINTTSIDDIEIWAEDSIYVLVEVTIDPTDGQLPFIVEDDIIFGTTSGDQNIHLQVWGQNAHFFGKNTTHGSLVASTGDTTWTNDLPYVIFESITIDTLHKLTIEPGTRIHLHNGGSIIVKGSLVVNGGSDSTARVLFSGTRLESNNTTNYQELPGQWGGIFFLEGSINNSINNAYLRNGSIGIYVEKPPVSGTQPNLILQNTVIRDMYFSALSIFNAVVSASNVLIHDCVKSYVQISGGECAFTNCTFAAYDGTNRQDPAYIFRNFYEDNTGTINVADRTSLNFYNSILMGQGAGQDREEILITNINQVEGFEHIEVSEFTVHFDHCAATTAQTGASFFADCLFNLNAADVFTDPIGEVEDYQLAANSPCINYGITADAIQNPIALPPPTTDLTGKPRTDLPDIGCFEY